MVKQGHPPKYRLVVFILFLIIFIAAITTLFLIRNNSDKSNYKSNNLSINPSFEDWKGNTLVGWKNHGATLLEISDDVTEGKYAVGIYSKDKTRRSISQNTALNPNEVYYICFSLQSDGINKNEIGFEVAYEGEDLKTTIDMDPGIHFYDGQENWRQYFGSVTGASSLRLSFFSAKNTVLKIDGIWIGTEFAPVLQRQAKN